MLQDVDITHIQSACSPLPLHCKLKPDEGTPLANSTYYRIMVGTLNFLTHTRPDLSFAQALSQFMQSPFSTHLDALQHTLKYLHAPRAMEFCSKDLIHLFRNLILTQIGLFV